jgi:alkylation response protein AidB-like acyl-CoA dehydrogenase
LANYLADNDDLLFYLERGIDWAPIVAAVEQDYRAPQAYATCEEAVASYREILEMVGTFAAEEVAPQAVAIDRKGVKLKDGEAVMPPELDAIFEQIKALDLHSLSLPRELGGVNCPMIIHFMVTEVLARADVSVMAHYNFHSGIALSLLMYSVNEGTTSFDRSTRTISKTRFAGEIAEILRGDAFGSMDITEPDAGSDMGALKCKGEQDEHGDWFVTGQKIFITSGHGKYHIVIARTEPTGSGSGPGKLGLDGLSLFLVPAYEDLPDGTRKRLSTLDRLEEKLGHEGSATAAITFDRTPAHLIGARGEGFKQMLMLMNNARIGVGFESIGLCEAAYRLAKAYAAERRSMGKTIDRHEMIADYLDEMRTDIQGLRALAMHASVHEEMGQRLKMQALLDTDDDSLERARLLKQARRHAHKARKVTPLLKYAAAEKAVEMGRRCVQIHGGSGYTKDYAAERLLRDALVMPIYEGTSQIQSLMAMKDAMSNIMRNPQKFLTRVAQSRWRSLSALDPLERRVARVTALSLSAQQHLIQRTATDKLRSLGKHKVREWSKEFFQNWEPKRDFAYAMLHAERLTRLMTDVAISEALLVQARQHPERRELLERYLDRAEPRCTFLHDEITTRGDRLLSTLREQSDEPAAAKA